MSRLEELPSPSVLLELPKVEANIARMQAVCDRHGVGLRPHIKTHKMVEVGRRQIEAGAAGLTCAKLSEAEQMVPTGVKSIFIANSLVDKEKAARLKALTEQVEEVVLAATSVGHAVALDRLVAHAGIVEIPVMIAVDSGLHREGARTETEAKALYDLVVQLSHLRPIGIYTHEGHFYSKEKDQVVADMEAMMKHLIKVRDLLDPALEIWPGCSVTAERLAALPGVDSVRPGAYMFGDLALAYNQDSMKWEDVAITVQATVVDRPTRELALIDAGSKVFSSDKSKQGWHALPLDRRDFRVTRCNEEHGYVEGPEVESLRIGDRVRFVVAHVCPVINLTDRVVVHDGDEVLGTWNVEARGCTY